MTRRGWGGEEGAGSDRGRIRLRARSDGAVPLVMRRASFGPISDSSGPVLSSRPSFLPLAAASPALHLHRSSSARRTPLASPRPPASPRSTFFPRPR